MIRDGEPTSKVQRHVTSTGTVWSISNKKDRSKVQCYFTSIETVWLGTGTQIHFLFHTDPGLWAISSSNSMFLHVRRDRTDYSGTEGPGHAPTSNFTQLLSSATSKETFYCDRSVRFYQQIAQHDWKTYMVNGQQVQACWVTERTENVSVHSMLESSRSLSRLDWKCNDAASNVFLGIHHDIVVNCLYSSYDSAICCVFDSCLSLPHSVLQRSLDALPTAFLDKIADVYFLAELSGAGDPVCAMVHWQMHYIR